MYPVTPNSTIIDTERLRIRKIAKPDIDDIYAVFNDPDIMKWVEGGHPIDYTDCERWVEITLNNYQTLGYGLFAVTTRNTGEVIGFCGLIHHGADVDPELTFAFKREYWGHGYATESVSAMVRYAQHTFGFTSITATVTPENIASQHVLEKSGLRYRRKVATLDGHSTLLFAR